MDGVIDGALTLSQPPWQYSGARTDAATQSMTPERPASPLRSTSARKFQGNASWNRLTQPPTDSSPISEAGRRLGATSTGSSASPVTSSSLSTTQAQAFPSASPRHSGA